MLAEARGIQSPWIWAVLSCLAWVCTQVIGMELRSSTGAQSHEKHVLDSPAKLTCQSSNPDPVLLQPNGARTGRVLQDRSTILSLQFVNLKKIKFPRVMFHKAVN